MLSLQHRIIRDNSPPSCHIYSVTKTIKLQMRKIYILAFTILFINFKVNSQITKGNWLVGGTANFTSTTFKSDAGQRNTAFTIQIAPNIGYFISDKFATGVKVSIGKQGTKATGTSIYGTYTDANFGPFLRYYFLPAEKQINILAEGVYQYGMIKGDHDKVFKNTFTFSTGPVIYFNSSVGIEFLLGYSTSKYVGFAGSNGSIQAGLGLQVHLEKDK